MTRLHMQDGSVPDSAGPWQWRRGPGRHRGTRVLLTGTSPAAPDPQPPPGAPAPSAAALLRAPQPAEAVPHRQARRPAPHLPSPTAPACCSTAPLPASALRTAPATAPKPPPDSVPIARSAAARRCMRVRDRTPASSNSEHRGPGSRPFSGSRGGQ